MVIWRRAMGTWAVAEAKAKFSEVIESARVQGAQEITRNGKLVGILVSPEEWRSAKRTPAQNERTMSDFFRNSPLAGSGLDLSRSRTKARKVAL
ncbi:MAG: type II toxin-antitoxin system prevent-host-death family antitoxin [Acidobacteriota bacterium]|nr:type II toxin-antitoxin system prevent-host-death family antitoxin [Acidobacteriota bacterium]